MDQMPCSLLARPRQYDFEFIGLAGHDGPLARTGPPNPFSATIVSSRRPFCLLRSWEHIRGNQEQVVILRYVKAGVFLLTQGDVRLTVRPGQFVFSKCNVPFRWERTTDDFSISEYGAILLPPDLVHRFFPDGVPLKQCLSVSDEQRLAMPTLLTLLTEDGTRLDAKVTSMLVETVLEEARDIAARESAGFALRKNICNQRTDEIIAYIGMHLSNPDLCATAVARACGISPRYLCYLLKLKNTSFSVLLWEQRLKKAHEWLLSSDTGHYTIGEIAYMNGFKTAAHFSRLFRHYYGYSPREMRRSGAQSGRAALCEQRENVAAHGLPDGACIARMAVDEEAGAARLAS